MIDRGLNLSERAPRVYEERCPACNGFMTSDSAYGCTPGSCANVLTPLPECSDLRQNFPNSEAPPQS